MNLCYRLEQAPSEVKGQNIVFIHGWGSDNQLWLSLRRHLPGQHWALDLPGFGRNTGAEAIALEDFIEWAARELPESCLLVGWSLGGMIACHLAALRPERVAGLVTLACNPCFVARPDWPWAMPSATYQSFCQDFAAAPQKTWQRFCALQGKGDEQRKAVVQQLKQQPAPEQNQWVNWQNSLHWLHQLDNRTVIAAMPVPHLHLLGEQDALVPAEWVKQLPALLAGEPGQSSTGGALTASLHPPQVRVLAGRGHALLLGAIAPVVDAVHQFLAALPSVIGKSRIAQSFAKAAQTYDAAAHTQAQVGQRLLAWLPPVSAEASVLDLGCGTGFISRQWSANQDKLPRIVHLDLAEGMVRYARRLLTQQLPQAAWVVADGEALPFAQHSFSGVLSNLAIQWCNNLPLLAREVARVLQPGGWFLCSTLGPETLSELKNAWAALDQYVHVNDFAESELVRGTFADAGLSVEVFERQTLTANYPALLPLVKDLKAIGAHNMNQGCNPGLTSIRQWRALEQVYEAYRSASGSLPASYDVFYFLVRKSYE